MTNILFYYLIFWDIVTRYKYFLMMYSFLFELCWAVIAGSEREINDGSKSMTLRLQGIHQNVRREPVIYKAKKH